MNFNDDSLKNVADSVRDVLNQNNVIGRAALPDGLKQAAVNAGIEARGEGMVPVETRNKIFTQHMMDNSNGNILSTSQASEFMDIAMNSYKNGENK